MRLGKDALLLRERDLRRADRVVRHMAQRATGPADRLPRPAPIKRPIIAGSVLGCVQVIDRREIRLALRRQKTRRRAREIERRELLRIP